MFFVNFIGIFNLSLYCLNFIKVRSREINLKSVYGYENEEENGYENEEENEVCIVLFGKIGNGKSCIGNIIFNENFFKLLLLGLFVMFCCFSRYVKRFGRKVLVVDILGILDISVLNNVV